MIVQPSLLHVACTLHSCNVREHDARDGHGSLHEQINLGMRLLALYIISASCILAPVAKQCGCFDACTACMCVIPGLIEAPTCMQAGPFKYARTRGAHSESVWPYTTRASRPRSPSSPFDAAACSASTAARHDAAPRARQLSASGTHCSGDACAPACADHMFAHIAQAINQMCLRCSLQYTAARSHGSMGPSIRQLYTSPCTAAFPARPHARDLDLCPLWLRKDACQDLDGLTGTWMQQISGTAVCT